MKYDRLPIHEVPKLTDKEYYVRSCTALLDAVGGAICHIANIHKYARKEDIPERTLFIITTDGMGNASHRYTYKMVRQMIQEQKEKGWEFIFLGANIDAVQEAERFGIDESINASHRYTYKMVRQMIQEQKEKGWEFIFLGANIDAVQEAERFGIDESMAANYHCDEDGTALNYEVINGAISSVRLCEAPLTADWKKKIDEDYQSRESNR